MATASRRMMAMWGRWQAAKHTASGYEQNSREEKVNAGT